MLTPELIKEIHENAVAHGWWEGERDIAEIYALIHSELSEALEEYRSGKDMIYYVDGKPEGIAVELADAVIRILDYSASANLPIAETVLYIKATSEKRSIGTVELIAIGHMFISASYTAELPGMLPEDDVKPRVTSQLAAMIYIAENYFSDNGLDLYEIIRIKHEYNKTRPYRHGGKLC